MCPIGKLFSRSGAEQPVCLFSFLVPVLANVFGFFLRTFSSFGNFLFFFNYWVRCSFFFWGGGDVGEAKVKNILFEGRNSFVLQRRIELFFCVLVAMLKLCF